MTERMLKPPPSHQGERINPRTYTKQHEAKPSFLFSFVLCFVLFRVSSWMIFFIDSSASQS